MSKKTNFLALTLMLLIGGCVSQGDSKTTRYYFLSAPDLVTMPQPNINSTYVMLGPITFPDYLKRPAVVSIEGSNQILVSGVSQWVGDIEDEFQIALLKNLVALNPEVAIVKYPGNMKIVSPYQLQVTVLRFDSNSNGSVRLEALWYWLKDGQMIAANGRFAEQKNIGDGAASAAAGMSEMIAQFAQKVTQDLREVQRANTQ